LALHYIGFSIDRTIFSRLWRGSVALIFDPQPPWHLIISGLAILIILALLFRLFIYGPHYPAFSNSRIGSLTSLVSSIISVGLLAVVSWNPVQLQRDELSRMHVCVVLDVSESVLRIEEGWPSLQLKIVEWLQDAVEALPEPILQESMVSVITFGTAEAVAVRSAPLNTLPDVFQRLNPTDFAPPEGSNLAAGLTRAERLILDAKRPGVVLLITDGNQTTGDGLAAAERLSRHGIPIYVYPVESPTPALAIYSADLPRQAYTGVETYLRGMIRNSTQEAITAVVGIYKNQSLYDKLNQFGPEEGSESQRNLVENSWSRLRQPIVFEGAGLQFVDVAIRQLDNNNEHRRRFYTMVYQPPRILAVGGDLRWVGAFDAGRLEITRLTPAELSNQIEFNIYDAVVLSSVPANALAEDIQMAIATAVEKDGVGLMVLNGGHQGLSEETPTILMSYEESSLEPLLPLSKRPRPFTPEPPPRQVIILIDASGSMSGAPLAKAKEISQYIIEQLLRDQDRLDLLAFTTDAHHLIKDTQMDSIGKQQAVRQLNSIQAGGGTDPNRALSLLSNQQMTNCGLIFISDGEFYAVQHRPDCRATVFAIGYSSVPSSSPLWALADPFPVGHNFDPSVITIPYFDPEARDMFFEPGDFMPYSMDRVYKNSNFLPVPEIPLPGAAVTYLKDEAELIAARPKFIDPVLAYKTYGKGYVGEFTSEFNELWLDSPDGRNALEAWLLHLVPFSARDRYDFHLRDDGSRIDLDISVNPPGQKLPQITGLTAYIELGGRTQREILLRPVPMAPGTFRGFIQVERKEQAQLGFLVLRETGPDSITRPQRIPILIPSIGRIGNNTSDEAFTYGTNIPLLRQIAELSSGEYAPPPGTVLLRNASIELRVRSYVPFLVTVAVAAFLVSIAVRRLDR
jgi:Mg-chelatase subunit ChlD